MSPVDPEILVERAIDNINVFYRLRDHPIYMMTITKCGCTFLKNLFYYIDHGEAHPLGDQIHRDESRLLRSDAIDAASLMASPYVFAVIRNPLSRFLSLYYEKIVNPKDTGMMWFRDEIGYDLGMNFEPDLDLVGHQKNTMILIEWLGQNIRKENDHFIDYHWRPQFYKFRRIRGFKPHLIALEQLDAQLPMLLEPELPNIRQDMATIRSRNHSHKPYSFAQTTTPELVDAIQKIYKADTNIYNKIKDNQTPKRIA